jgi:hypothetical protein
MEQERPGRARYSRAKGILQPATATKPRVRPALETTEDRNQVKEEQRSAPKSNQNQNRGTTHMSNKKWIFH